eukprot:2380848-Pleurochrysis_carterae.AAC.2
MIEQGSDADTPTPCCSRRQRFQCQTEAKHGLAQPKPSTDWHNRSQARINTTEAKHGLTQRKPSTDWRMKGGGRKRAGNPHKRAAHEIERPSKALVKYARARTMPEDRHWVLNEQRLQLSQTSHYQKGIACYFVNRACEARISGGAPSRRAA